MRHKPSLQQRQEKPKNEAARDVDPKRAVGEERTEELIHPGSENESGVRAKESSNTNKNVRGKDFHRFLRVLLSGTR